MVDFLTRLAERTLGVASMVRPIITPMFAPEPRPANEASSSYRAGDSEAQSLVAPGPAEGIQPVRPGDMLIGTAHDHRMPAEVQLNFPPALLPMNDYQGIPGTRYEQAGSSQSQHAPGQLLTATHRSVPAMHTPVKSDQDVTTLGPQDSPELVGREGSPPATSTESRAHALVAKTPRSMPGLAHARTPDALLPVQYFEASPPEKSAPAPAIRVTIGRIEVRAVMPSHEPAERATPTRPRPKLSLDDYLKQRNGG